MESFFASIPTTPQGWFITFILLIIACFYLFSRVRRQDMELLRKANTDLRLSINDGEKKIEVMQSEVKILTEKVIGLEKENRTISDLVVTALKQYFFENPTIASDMKKSIIR